MIRSQLNFGVRQTHIETGACVSEEEGDLVGDWILNAETIWASRRLSELSRTEPSAVLGLIQAIQRRNPSDRVLANLAAGPLEDLLVYKGPEVIDQLETLARSDAAFRSLLAGVWRNRIREDVWKRVQALID
jgi:uncharacterized protein DUF6869